MTAKHSERDAAPDAAPLPSLLSGGLGGRNRRFVGDGELGGLFVRVDLVDDRLAVDVARPRLLWPLRPRPPRGLVLHVLRVEGPAFRESGRERERERERSKRAKDVV